MGRGGQFEPSQVPVIILLAIVLVCIQLLFHYGLVSMALKKLRGQPIQVGDFFGAVRYLPRLIGATFCMAAITMVCYLACIVPGLWATGAFYFSPFIILDQDRGVFESLQKSYSVAGNFMVGLTMFGMLFLIGLLTGVGGCACYVGLLATVPLGVIAATVEYYYFFPEAFGTPQNSAAPEFAG